MTAEEKPVWHFLVDVFEKKSGNRIQAQLIPIDECPDEAWEDASYRYYVISSVPARLLPRRKS